MIRTGRPLHELLELVVITDPGARSGPVEMALTALRAGARTVQVRWKGGATREVLALARALRAPTREAGALLIINDRADVALVADADGVHVGEDDLPVDEVRRITAAGFVIGRSVDTPLEAIAAEEAGADYVGFGPIHPTGTKSDTGPVVGEEMLSAVRQAVGIPIVAIGGISRENAGGAIRAGADGVAVISAISGSEDPEAATAGILTAVRRAGGIRSGVHRID